MDLRRRVRVLEQHHADRIDDGTGHDSRWEPAVRERIVEWNGRLRSEESTFEQMREATRRMIGLISAMTTDGGRRSTASRQGDNLDDAWNVALSAVSGKVIRVLRAACEALAAASERTR